MTAPKSTLFVNMFASACAGKSGVAGGVFSKLKALGMSVSLVQEFAKEALVRRDYVTFNNKVLVNAVQYDRQVVNNGNFDIVVTDSPLLLGIIYPGNYGCGPDWERTLIKQFLEFRNLNFYLVRGTEYVNEFRAEDKEAALRKDIELRALMDSLCLTYTDVMLGEDTVDRITIEVVRHLAKQCN